MILIRFIHSEAIPITLEINSHWPTFPPQPFPFNPALNNWLERHLMGDLMHIVVPFSFQQYGFSFKFLTSEFFHLFQGFFWQDCSFRGI